MTAEILLSIRNLSVRAGSRRLLDDFDLDLHTGQIVALRGASGSGKTTLLRTLACLQDPTNGTLTLRGDAPADLGWPAWRRRVGLVPQLPVMLFDTVGEELAHAFTYRGAIKKFDPDRAARMLSALRLDAVKLDDAPQELSVGQQQRLALVRALLLDPEVLLLDEPTSTLDADAAEAVRQLVRAEISLRPAAALVVTHDTGHADRWCDRVLDLQILATEARG